MKLIVILCLLAVAVAASIIGKKAVGAKGTLLCGNTPASNVRVRLFRVKPGKKDG